MVRDGSLETRVIDALNAKPAGRHAPAGGRLTPLTEFGANPGALDGWTYVPAKLRRGTALVVVLHGCTQSAAAYDHGSGWSALADTNGFALLFPEQRQANNANRCFNWFEPADVTRGQGEVASIAAMVDAVVARHGIDPARVFVTGLSAGGAMAGAMLATYPEMFAGGAIVAGLAYGVASDVGSAVRAMHAAPRGDAVALAGRVLGASAHTGPWPRLSVWHGDGDRTVVPANADAIVRQWVGVRGLPATPDREDAGAGYRRRLWLDGRGRPAIEEWRIAGMGHGTPVGEGTGTAGPFMLDVGLSSTRRIAAFWGIAPVVPMVTRRAAEAAPPPPPRRTRRLTPEPLESARAPAGVSRVIEDALRKAGLMK